MSANLNKGSDGTGRFNLVKSGSSSKQIEASVSARSDKTKTGSKPLIWFLVLLFAGICIWLYATRDISPVHENFVNSGKMQKDSVRLRNGNGKIEPIPASEENISKSSAVETVKHSVTAFGAGSSDLPNVSEELVTDLIAALNARSDARITVLGYASSEGNPAANKELSELRASAFRMYLIKKGISAAKITISGKGTDDPIASNESPEGRSRNRRVEIVIVNQ